MNATQTDIGPNNERKIIVQTKEIISST